MIKSAMVILALTASLSVNAANLNINNMIPKIVGGEEAQVNEFPFMVSLQRSKSHFCGGSLIKKNWVLTAAHCVGSTSGLNVVLGLHSQSDMSKAEVLKAKRWIKHPGFDSSTLDWDYSLIELETDSKMEPVTLNEAEIMIGQEEIMSTTIGWGYTSEGAWQVADKLMKVNVPLVPADVCNVSYDNGITDRMICAGLPEGGKDSCQGDSGGPLFVRDAEGKILLAGIVSWGEGCARPDKYGVYSKVNAALKWIEETTTAQ